ncbi:hypothetical protein GQ43DRAFT_373376 [Delitschia confertaspora ATCC 74209]|uniref:Uncharacterized protein n=1 Tax=Delitschia confertaspora ATCC 74209 TaxID=1513339 RepID=A0A9P4JK48_9PLEO|nr:hypothetical protein GQ43DRAFT_373376 [Delitschia confertaspora ATCC 74209]
MKCGLYQRPRLWTQFVSYRAGRQCRFYSTPKPEPGEGSLGPTLEDGHRTLRLRRNGKPLPLPPLLDPVVLRERGRWEQPKSRPDIAKLTPFQQKLYQNPYAHALAVTPRQCGLTSVLLPKTFMLTLRAEPHPETSDPWMLPLELSSSHPSSEQPARVVSQYFALKFLQRTNWSKIMSPRFKEKLRNKLHKLVWREDLPDLILSLLQKNVVGKLRWHMEKPGNRLVACASPHKLDLEPIEDVSCVLYLDSLQTPADELQEKAEAIVAKVEAMISQLVKKFGKVLDPHAAAGTHHPPPWFRGPVVPHLQPRKRFAPLRFSTADWRGRRVALYSLHDMLGEEKMRELVRGTQFEKATCIVIKGERNNIKPQMLLMQLQAFLAMPGP